MKQALSTFNWVVYSKFLLFLVSLFVAGRGTPSRASDGHLSNTQKWIVQGDMLTKQEISLGRGAWVESSSVREHRRNALLYACSLGFYVIFRIVAGQSLWQCVCHSAKMDSSEEDSGRWVWHVDWHLILTFLELFWLVSTTCYFHIPCRTSCLR